MKSTAFAALKRERVHSTQTVAEMVPAHQTDPTAWPMCTLYRMSSLAIAASWLRSYSYISRLVQLRQPD